MIKTIEQIEEMIKEESERHKQQNGSILAEVRETLSDTYGVRHQFKAEVELNLFDKWVGSLIFELNKRFSCKNTILRVVCAGVFLSPDRTCLLCLVKIIAKDSHHPEYEIAFGQHCDFSEYLAYLERQKAKEGEQL